MHFIFDSKAIWILHKMHSHWAEKLRMNNSHWWSPVCRNGPSKTHTNRIVCWCGMEWNGYFVYSQISLFLHDPHHRRPVCGRIHTYTNKQCRMTRCNNWRVITEAKSQINTIYLIGRSHWSFAMQLKKKNRRNRILQFYSHHLNQWFVSGVCKNRVHCTYTHIFTDFFF